MKTVQRSVYAYICEICNKEYDNHISCSKCEDSCKNKIRNLEFSEIVPSRNPNDSRYESHCIFCDNLLERYDAEFDGHRYDPGTKIFSTDYCLFFNSKVCANCYSKIRIFLIENKEKFKTHMKKSHD